MHINHLSADPMSGGRPANDRLSADPISGGRPGNDHLPDDHLPDDHLPDDHLPDDQLPDDQLPDDQLPDDQLANGQADAAGDADADDKPGSAGPAGVDGRPRAGDQPADHADHGLAHHGLADHGLADHRRLGRELKLFATEPLVGAGLPLWLPDGAVIRAELEKLAAEEAIRGGCQRVFTPVLAKRALFERSGHWDKFAADMFPPMRVGEEEFVLRPANCPHHALVYASEQHSYRHLPVRLAELGAMFRSELSGVLGGLSRVRQINLDDTHVFCTPDQVPGEIARAVRSVQRCYRLLGIDVARYRLSRRGDGDGYLGERELWAAAERHLAEGLHDLGLDYEDAPGEAAFYGPKIDVQVVDPAGREETLSTVQLDFNQPERFDLAYIGPDGARHRPVMIHRGVLSAMERLAAFLIERYDGAFPPWLAPVQVLVLPVAEQHAGQAGDVTARMSAAGLRAECDPPDATLGARIRRARERRIPYLAVIGDREAAADQVALRLRDGRRLDGIGVERLVDEVSCQVADRSPGLGFG
jgi:threonyl-tRNA synthetase